MYAISNHPRVLIFDRSDRKTEINKKRRLRGNHNSPFFHAVFDVCPCGIFSVSSIETRGFSRGNQRFLRKKPLANLIPWPRSTPPRHRRRRARHHWNIRSSMRAHPRSEILSYPMLLLVRFNNAKIRKKREKASYFRVKIVKNLHSVTHLSYMPSSDYQQLTSNNDRMTVFNQKSYWSKTPYILWKFQLINSYYSNMFSSNSRYNMTNAHTTVINSYVPLIHTKC